MILDDGGDATMMVLKGAEWENDGKVPAAKDDAGEDWVELFKAMTKSIKDTGGKKWNEISASIKGVTEETTTGVHRLYQMQQSGELKFPAMNVNDAVTKSKFDNVYGCRHSPRRRNHARHRRHALRQDGGRVRLRRRRQRLGTVAARPGRPRGHHRDRPNLRAAGTDGRLRRQDDRRRGRRGRHLRHDDGQLQRHHGKDHMAKMKHNAIVGNIGHFDNEIDMAAVQKAGVKRENIKPQVDRWVFPDGHGVIVLAEGRLLNLGCATGHPSFVMSASFTNQVMAQIELFNNADNYENAVYVLPKELDEKVARLHLDKLGAKLTKMTKAQSDYIGIPVEGPYKPSHYRY